MDKPLPAKNARILVVDDDQGLLGLLERMLTRLGAVPDMVETGGQALEVLKSKQFDLVILDLMLPDVDGLDVLAQIRQELHLDDLPVIILSALANPDIISRGLALGADGYLTKPYLPNTLTSRVETLLQQGRRPKVE
jgi:DNA-binding response OmpR family regulator